MFFKRQKGQYHEVERVTRFKLIKSGKHWLRAATSQFGLLRLMKGADISSVEVKVAEEQSVEKAGLNYLKGIIATGAVLGGAVVTSSSVYAEEEQAHEKVIDNPCQILCLQVKALQRALQFQLVYLYQSRFQYQHHYHQVQVYHCLAQNLQVPLSLFQCPQVRLNLFHLLQVAPNYQIMHL